MEKYQIHKQIGSGAFALVSKATNRSTSEIVAIKKMKKRFSTWDECLSLCEIKSLTKLKHPNIIKLIEVIRSNDELFCVFEFAQQTLYSLYLSYKEQGQSLPEPLIKSFLFQTAQGLAYMHKNGFFHRDMKPENLLLLDKTVKIADFGLAREIRARPPYTDYVSTRWYRAPELLLKSQNYNSPVDIYALGCIMAELYNQSPLFAGSSELDQLNKICSVLGTPNQNTWSEGMLLAVKSHFTFPQFPGLDLSSIVPTANVYGVSLLRDMLSMDPFRRPTAAQILQHAYFQENFIHNGLYERSKDTVIPKKDPIKEKREEEIEAEEGIKYRVGTPGDSPVVFNPKDVFRKVKKKEEIEEKAVCSDEEFEFTPKNKEKKEDSFGEEENLILIEKEKKPYNSPKKLVVENPLTVKEFKQYIEDHKEVKEVSHSLSPFKFKEKTLIYNERSLDRNRDWETRYKEPGYINKESNFKHKENTPKHKGNEGKYNEFALNNEENSPFTKEINFFQKKTNLASSSIFQSKTPLIEYKEIKPKMNLPKLNPISNIKDLKDPFYNNNYEEGLKSSNYRLPELNKRGNALNREEKIKQSPNKRIFNLDPIQYQNSKDYY